MNCKDVRLAADFLDRLNQKKYTAFMPEEHIRTFFAMKIDEACKQHIATVLINLRQECGDQFRWVKPHNLHLTIKFIGNFLYSDLNKIKSDLTIRLNSIQPFTIQIKGLGTFPNNLKPRVIWLGLNYPAELERLCSIINGVCERNGYEIEKRPFSPHLTLGRIKKHTSNSQLRQISSFLESFKIGEICKFQVNAISFYQSTLKPEGPIYHELLNLKFKNIMSIC